MSRYTARLVKGGSNSWVVEFRHPVLKDRQGKQGRKIRRGLGPNELEAQKVVDDLNLILADPNLWTLASQREAKKKFCERSVEIFFDQLEEDVVEDSWNYREQFYSLQDNPKGYARVLLLGTTGAGKTTLIRQIIGTDPDEISFPAISSSRTTTCNIEYIFSGNDKPSAIVTFLSQAQTLKLIEECVWEAFKRAIIGDDRKRIAKSLLTHPENSFRLSYILGQYRTPDVLSIKTDEKNLIPPYPEQGPLYDTLDSIIGNIIELASAARSVHPPEVDEIDESIDLKYEDWVREDNEIFYDLVELIFREVKQRFENVTVGRMKRDTRGWPIYWIFDAEDKLDLIREMKWFAGNDRRRFGQLLAPLVTGIRLRAPFKPQWWGDRPIPPLILIDGEGVGHESSITTNLPIEVTTQFQHADVIAVVDNACQPMLDVTKVILRDASSRGQQHKMVIAYTRFDQVEGSNMLDDEERREHILNIQESAIEALQSSYNLNAKMVRALRIHLSENCFFFKQANELRNPPAELSASVRSFIDKCMSIFKTKPEIDIMPVPTYDNGRLMLVVSEASDLFMQKWLGLLGIENTPFQKQHWTRIKALTNRLSSGLNRYDDLEPASDLAGYLMLRLENFLETPVNWDILTTSDEERHLVIQKIRDKISAKINELAIKRVKIDKQDLWLKAYSSYKGPGSAKDRAFAIRNIFEQTVTKPQIAYDALTENNLVEELNQIIKDVVKSMKES